MSTDFFSSAVFRVLALLIVGFGLYKFFFANDSPTRDVIFVNKELGIAGEVTSLNKARGYKIYLNDSPTPYNFDDFENAQFQPNSGLGYYLEAGDHVEKAANSDTITVTKKGQLSHWYLAAPRADAAR